MVSAWLLSALGVGYLAVLFAIAAFGDRTRLYPTNPRLRPVIYGLALGVYCTSWTFFGAVGTAVRDGWAYLPIYLGPALVLLLAAPFLGRLVQVARARNVGSIADFLASRFGKSRALGALVALMALIAVTPYLALQYKAVAASIDVLTATPAGVDVPWWRDTALVVALSMAAFAILFGTRRVSASEHHEGLMLAIAFESLVKLLAFVALGFWAWRALEPGAAAGVADHGLTVAALGASFADANFMATTLLAACAVFCLPRMFHVGVVECAEPGDVRHARWAFPAYLAVISVCVVPVVALGVQTGLAGHGAPDTLLLRLPLADGQTGLALAAFLGGLSAATAMVIVSSLALATMLTNDLIVPALGHSRLVATERLGRQVLWIRRAAIVGLALLAYAYYRNATTPASLAAIGLLAFAAAAQFAPGILAALYWRGASRHGVFWGLCAGFALWLYTLVLPTLAPVSPWVVAGPLGVEWLRPGALVGPDGVGATAQGAILAFTVNVALLIGISLRWGTTLPERVAARAFLATDKQLPLSDPGARFAGAPARADELEALAARIVGPAGAHRMLAEYAQAAGTAVPKAGDAADRGLLQHVERVLAGSIGASTARVLLTHTLRRRGLDVDEVAELLDETSQELRFSRQLLQATMENVSQGISVVDTELKLVAWNRRYVEMFDYPESLMQIGRPVADLIRWNAERGECGPGDPETQVRKRLAHLTARTPYVFRRERRSGRVYEIRGQPLPDGGYVSTYTDVTDYVRTEQALIEAKQGLERRVDERTQALQEALAAEAAAKRQAEIAKQQAEEANFGKTRFVAAASHDLLQPLNAARLFASALQSQASAEPELRDLATRIDGSMRAAEELLDGLLEVAKLDAGALKPEVGPFALGELLADLERQYAPIARARGLELRVPTTRGVVVSDRVLLRRVLQNYLANALRYTRRGGVVVAVRRCGREWAIRVSDTGPGIAAHDQAAIYGEFRRLERGSPWGEKGLGLGLSICDRIARLLGHALELRSEPGRGSTFGVRVPRGRTQDVPAPRPAAVLAGAPLDGLVVLCLDNDPAILDGMAALLGRWGVRVRLARDGAQACVEFAHGDVDVVLADYRLDGGEDGLGVLTALRRGGVEPVSGALLTAEQGEALHARARALGYSVLRKPVKPAALRALLTAARIRSGGTTRAAAG